MPAALLDFLLLAATVDPRLAGPLRLLAEAGARVTIDGHIGPFFADLPETLGLTLAVAEPPRGAARFLHSPGSRVPCPGGAGWKGWSCRGRTMRRR